MNPSLRDPSDSRGLVEYFGNRSVLGEAGSCLRQNELTFVTHVHETKRFVNKTIKNEIARYTTIYIDNKSQHAY